MATTTTTTSSGAGGGRNNESTRPPLVARAGECTYTCGDCGQIVVLKITDPPRCDECGYRILYKTRSKKALQYEAR